MKGNFTPQIETALSALKEEHKRVTAERAAFARFRNHIAAMETASTPAVRASTRQPVSSIAKTVSSDQRLEDVQKLLY